MNQSRILLESPVFTAEAALKAAEYGVDRLELCSSFQEGGETPSAGMFRYIKSNVSIPVFVMIRPRGGDFVYSEDELQIMIRDIQIFNTFGADGFVFGALTPGGEVDQSICDKLIKTAGNLPCTFHRAIDVSIHIERSLEAVISCGFQRVLTSGGKPAVREGLPTIRKLLELAGDRIIVMPGGGMEPELAAPLRETGYLREVHASCKQWETPKGKELPSGGDQRSGILTINRKKVEQYKEVF